MYTLGEAAKATGKSKAAISKAIKSGRISASKQTDGVYKIDPSELHRVYPPVSVNSEPEPQDNTVVSTENALLVRELQIRLEVAEQRLAESDSRIADIKEERDRWRQQAQALLTDQRDRPRSSWSELWSRMLRR